MVIPKTYILSLALIALLSLNVQAQKEDELPTREKWELVEMEGKVTDINKETRALTLIGPVGDLITVTASEEVKRFDEIEVDDVVTFDYWTYMKAEFRDPTPEEVAEPVVKITEAGKAPEGMGPDAVVGSVVKSVVTIEALNRPFMMATVSGPEGNFVTIAMKDENLMKKLHIGQVLILTYAETIVVSLEHVKAAE